VHRDRAAAVFVLTCLLWAGGSGAVGVYDPTGSLLGTTRAAFEPDPSPPVRGGLVAGVVKDTRCGIHCLVQDATVSDRCCPWALTGAC
jgi:hypothetical protein